VAQTERLITRALVAANRPMSTAELAINLSTSPGTVLARLTGMAGVRRLDDGKWLRRGRARPLLRTVEKPPRQRAKVYTARSRVVPPEPEEMAPIATPVPEPTGWVRPLSVLAAGHVRYG
jgi:hypothetical protein